MKKRSIFSLLAMLPTIALAAPNAHAVPTGYEQDVRAYNLAHGRVVFNDKCMKCHEGGKRGAPVLGNGEDWATRLQKPLSVLIKNAQAGHGDMPPKGDLELTDQDIASAVAYVTHHSRRILADRINDLPPTSAGGAQTSSATEIGRCSTDSLSTPCVAQSPARDVVLNMFLMLFGKERWK